MACLETNPLRWSEHRACAIARARIALARCTDPTYAWQLLVESDALPLAWLDDPARQFCELADWSALAAGPPALDTLPPTAAACLAVAERFETVAIAEALAWELAYRLRDWGGAWPARVRWALTRAPLPHALEQTAVPRVAGALLAAFYAWQTRAGVVRRDRSAPRRARLAAAYLARQRACDRATAPFGRPPRPTPADPTLAVCAARWGLMIREGVAFNAATLSAWKLPREWVGYNVAHLPDPLEPLRELAALGVSAGPVTADALYLAMAV